MGIRTADMVEWQLLAACRGPHASVFFPPSHTEKRNEKRQRESKAKGICATCPVRQNCLEYALKVGEQHGIWGGLNEIERRHLLDTNGSR